MNAPEASIRFKDMDELTVIYRALYDLGYRRTMRPGETLEGGIANLRRRFETHGDRYIATYEGQTGMSLHQDAGTILMNSLPQLAAYIRVNGFPRRRELRHIVRPGGRV